MRKKTIIKKLEKIANCVEQYDIIDYGLYTEMNSIKIKDNSLKDYQKYVFHYIHERKLTPMIIEDFLDDGIEIKI